MRKLKKIIILALIAAFTVSMLFIGTSCKPEAAPTEEAVEEVAEEAVEEVAEEEIAEEEWTPYYLTDEFKPYTELPKLTKDELGDIEDEMTVMPVDRVAPEPLKFAYIGGATNPFFDIVKAGVDEAAEILLLHNVRLEWIVPGSTLSSADAGMAIEALVDRSLINILYITL